MGKQAQVIAENQELLAALEEMKVALKAAQTQISLLDSHVRILLAKQFGKSSEKIDFSQLNLFGDSKTEPSEVETQEIPSHNRKKKKSKTEGRPAFPDHLPRNEIHCELSGDDLICPTCEETLNEIGVDTCESGHFEPAKFTVNRIHKHKYGCPNGHLVKSAGDPEGHLPRCKYDPSVHAAVVTSRFGDHLPYYRQEAIFKRLGVSIPRQSMVDMAQRVAESAGLILKQMLKELIAEKVIQADETRIRVSKEGQKGSENGWMWVYRCEQKVLFDFTLSRGAESPSRTLRFFFGILQIDGWTAYNSIAKINQLTRAGCWAHARRKFHDSFKISKEGVDVLREIRKLYRLESALKKRRVRLSLKDEEFFALRKTVRQRSSKRVVNRIRELVLNHKEDPRCIPKSLLRTAVTYADNQWETLEVFLEHGNLEIDNNGAERAIRPIAIGRKNWMIVGNEKSGRTAAKLYSLIESCKAIDVNPQAYLEDVIARAPHLGESEMKMLTPWAWKLSQAEG